MRSWSYDETGFWPPYKEAWGLGWDKAWLDLVWVLTRPLHCIATIDHQDERIVDWKDGVLTVARHGRSGTYDFQNWTCSGDGCEACPAP